jgi:hypothetical protein
MPRPCAAWSGPVVKRWSNTGGPGGGPSSPMQGLEGTGQITGQREYWSNYWSNTRWPENPSRVSRIIRNTNWSARLPLGQYTASSSLYKGAWSARLPLGDIAGATAATCCGGGARLRAEVGAGWAGAPWGAGGKCQALQCQVSNSGTTSELLCQITLGGWGGQRPNQRSNRVSEDIAVSSIAKSAVKQQPILYLAGGLGGQRPNQRSNSGTTQREAAGESQKDETEEYA